MRGIIVRISPDQGFGFIRGDDDQEYFFHRTALSATRFEDLAPGSAVEFQIGRDPGDRSDEGPRAVSVIMTGDQLPAVDPLEPTGQATGQ